MGRVFCWEVGRWAIESDGRSHLATVVALKLLSFVEARKQGRINFGTYTHIRAAGPER